MTLGRGESWRGSTIWGRANNNQNHLSDQQAVTVRTDVTSDVGKFPARLL